MNRRLLLALTALLAACGVPTPREIALQTSADSKSLVREALETGQQTNAWDSLDKLYGSSSSRPKMPESTASDSALDVLSQYSDRIFADSNVVDKPFGAEVFALSGAILCTDPQASYPPSPDCVQKVDSLQLRIKVSSGLDFTLQVGPNHLEPLVLKLRTRSSISVEVDLEAAEKAMLFVNTELGNSSPLNGATLTAKGRLELKLQRNGDHDFTLSQSNLAAIDFKLVDANGVVRSYVSDSKSPVYSLRIEGPARKATVVMDQPRTEAHALSTDYGGSSIAISNPDGGITYQNVPAVPVAMKLSGLSAQLVVQDGKDPQLTHVGLGDDQSSITYDGHPLVTVDLNRSMGRHFDVAIKPSSTGLRLDVTPGIELIVHTVFSVLPAVYKANAAYADTTFTASFKASSGPASVDFVNGTANSSSAVRISAGTLTLSSTQPGEAPRTFSAGTCLGGGSSSSSSNPVLDTFSSVPCP